MNEEGTPSQAAPEKLCPSSVLCIDSMSRLFTCSGELLCSCLIPDTVHYSTQSKSLLCTKLMPSCMCLNIESFALPEMSYVCMFGLEM